MAVDVMHLSPAPAQSFAKMAFGGGKSLSSEDLSHHTSFSEQATLSDSPDSSAKSSVISLENGSFTEQEMRAVERLEASRRQLESEIDVSWCSGKARPGGSRGGKVFVSSCEQCEQWSMSL